MTEQGAEHGGHEAADGTGDEPGQGSTRRERDGRFGGRDPREIITPDAFEVDPELLGTPLAHPWRRGAAMAIDLALIGLLSSGPGALLAVAAGLVALHVALRPQPGVRGRHGLRTTLGCLGAVALFVAVLALWNLGRDLFEDEPPPGEGRPGIARTFLGELGLEQAAEATGIVRDAAALRRAESAAEARGPAERFARRLQDQGVDRDEIPDAIREVLSDKPFADEVARAAMAGAGPASGVAPPTDSIPTDSLVRSYLAALETADTAATRRIGQRLGARLAADRIQEVQERTARLRRQVRELEGELEEAEEETSLIGTLLGLADEVGIGFGWSGLYFTLFLTIWTGHTPGKRLLGIRVVRLDGKPIGLWWSFNRFGGYAASLFTGLIGFLEMFWDPNRQALHDRIAWTVVVREAGREDVERPATEPAPTEPAPTEREATEPTTEPPPAGD